MFTFRMCDKLISYPEKNVFTLNKVSLLGLLAKIKMTYPFLSRQYLNAPHKDASYFDSWLHHFPSIITIFLFFVTGNVAPPPHASCNRSHLRQHDL